ncbi:MAG: glycerate kinase [Propionibacteriaceae bacterium]|nr:glycerate kinase [Propionibacteriaceae bacterium]
MTITMPHRILVAPSGFKESLSAGEVADAIARGARRCLPGVVVETIPMVDGGEGTAAALADMTGGKLVPVTVCGPVGVDVESHIALLGGELAGTVAIDMASAAGLRLVPRDLRDPTVTTTRGVGQLILAALDAGARRIIIGCGDSGTSDGGAGLVQALGGRISDAQGRELAPGGAALADAVKLDLSDLDPRIAETEIVAACNMHNVLTGPRGVARVFGPQKGATPEQVERLASALERWADLLMSECGEVLGDVDIRTAGGSGASGGLGAALAAVCGARLATRFEVLLDPRLTGLELDEAIARADLVVTAEGAVDYQTPRGKVPAEVARRSKRYGKPVIAFAGSIGKGASAVHDVGIDAVVGMIPVPMTLAEAIENADELLADATERALRLVALGCVLAAR